MCSGRRDSVAESSGRIECISLRNREFGVKVGFIGLGQMGAPAAANIRRRGYDLIIHDLDRTRGDALVASGASWAETPAEVARQSDVLITMVPGPKQITAVMRGPGGVLEGLRSSALWVDMTTNSPSVFLGLAAEVRRAGAASIDAPVTGAVDGAIQARLTFFVGGDAAAVERVLPLLATMGRAIYMGSSGSGTITKLLTNQLWFIHAAAIGETLVLGKASGIDLLRLWEALKGSVADSFVCRHDVPSIFAGHYDPSFSLDLCCKDLDLIVRLAGSRNVPVDFSHLAQQKFERAREVFGGTAGELHVCKLIEDATGTPLQVAGDWGAPWLVPVTRTEEAP